MAQKKSDPLGMVRNQIVVTNVLDGLAQLPDASIDCVMTSPPYWGLRDYGIEPLIWGGEGSCTHEWQSLMANPQRERRNTEAKKAGGAAVSNTQKSASFAAKDFGQFCAHCSAWKGSLGLEPSIEMFLAHLLTVFDEIRRVLKPTGTAWVNLGDSYSGGWGLKARTKPETDTSAPVAAKSLCLVPHRFAIAMLQHGWILRNHIVWHKPNHMPASVRDRLANTWDHVFLFVKQKRYYFDLDVIRVPHRSLTRAGSARNNRSAQRNVGPDRVNSHHPHGKNPGDFWELPPETRRLGSV